MTHIYTLPRLEHTPNFTEDKTIWLPNPEIIIATIEKVLRAFENVIQTELLKIRWQEIRKSFIEENYFNWETRLASLW